MYLVNQITDDPLQSQSLILPDGNTIQMTLYFVQQQYGWFFNSLTYIVNGATEFTLNGVRVVNSPNMLNQYKNLIPFGLACYSSNDREPMFLQDFSSGNSVLYVLTPAEVAAYTEFLNGE